MRDDDRLNLILVMFGTAMGSFAGLLHEQDGWGVRWGEVASAGAVLASGVVLARKHSDPVPVIAAVVMAGGLLVAYEIMTREGQEKHGGSDGRV